MSATELLEQPQRIVQTTTLVRHVSDDERRARLAVRHHLASEVRAEDVTEAARDIVALHATDPASVFLAAAVRLRDPRVSEIEGALYETRTLVRVLAMRRTMWIVPTDQLAVIYAACGRAVAGRMRRTLVKVLQDGGLAGDVAEWLPTVEAATLEALRTRGEASGKELSDDVPDLRSTYEYGVGKKWGGTQTITSQVLNLMSADGKIVRARPRGTWASGQYRWSEMGAWLPEAALDSLGPDEAQVRLIRAWLHAFGPATVDDITWWTGLPLGQVRTALTAIGPVEVSLEGSTGVMLDHDVEPVAMPEPWVALLPALDPTAMGWKEREWYLDKRARVALFDRSGNIGPTVWCNGRIVGGWGQRKGGTSDGEIVYRLFEDIGSELSALVDTKAEWVAAWHGDVRVTPRFRTPLERELTA